MTPPSSSRGHTVETLKDVVDQQILTLKLMLEALDAKIEARGSVGDAQTASRINAIEEQIRVMQNNWNRRFEGMEERLGKQLSELTKSIDSISKRVFMGVGIVLTLVFVVQLLLPLIRHP